MAHGTRRLVGGVFELAVVGPQALKVLAEPVAAFAVTVVVRGPLVCRDAELAMIRDSWSTACAGEGQLVLLNGEADVGKSWIVQGLVEVLSDAHAHIMWQCSPYRTDTTLDPAIRQIARAVGFAQAMTRAPSAPGSTLCWQATASRARRQDCSRPSWGLPPHCRNARKGAHRTLEALIGWLEYLACGGPRPLGA